MTEAAFEQKYQQDSKFFASANYWRVADYRHKTIPTQRLTATFLKKDGTFILDSFKIRDHDREERRTPDLSQPEGE